MRVGGPSVQDRNVKGGNLAKEETHVVNVTLEAVCGLASDTNLVLAAELEAGGLVGDVGEENEALLLVGGALLDGFCEAPDLHDDGGHGGGEDGIELAEVCKVAGEVEGEGVEGVVVLCEEGEGVDGVDVARLGRSGGGHVEGTAGKTLGTLCWICAELAGPGHEEDQSNGYKSIVNIGYII